MTDEEIEKAATEIQQGMVRYCDQHPSDITFISGVIRALVSKARSEGRAEALDEAAKVAEQSRGEWTHSQHEMATDVAAAIRALQEK